MKRSALLIVSVFTLFAGPLKSEEVLVTATRDKCVVDKTPYYTDVMDSDRLRLEKAVRTMPDALKYQTGTLVQKTAHGQGSPYIRGFTGFRNLFLIDGIRLNNSVFRDGPNQYWNTVDVHGLSRIESVHGPFSVLYGSDAIGGTINAITRGTRDMRTDSRWDRRLYYRYADAENSHITHLESIGYLADKAVLTAGYSFKDFGDLEGGKDVGAQEKTGYDEQDWNAKLEYFLDDDTFVVVAHQGIDIDDAWRTHKTIYGIDWEGLSVGNELRRVLFQDRKLTYLQYHRYNMNGGVEEIHAGVSHHLQEEMRDRLRSGDRRDEQGFDVNTVGAFVQLKSPSSAGDLVYGTEYYHDDVDSYNNSLNMDGSIKNRYIQGPVGDEAVYDTLSAYVLDSVPVADRVSAIIGCRYDYVSADADSVQDPDTGSRTSIAEDWDSVVGSGRVLWRMDEQKTMNLFAGVSQGFRAPNLSDLTRLDAARTDEIETPSPDLDPEKFVSYEVGAKVRNDAVSGRIAYFYTDIEDMIIRTPTGRMIEEEYEVTKINAGDGFVEGVELQVCCNVMQSLSVFGMFTWFDGEVDTYPTSDPVLVSEPIDRLMPVTGTVGLRWNPTGKTWLEASCTAAEDADELSTRDASDTSRIPPGGTPGYTVYDIRGGIDVTDDVALSLSVENISDEDYRIHGSGVNEPGRNLVLCAEITM